MFNHVGDQARFQAVIDTSGPDKYLVMMWSVNGDPTAGDVLYFGFYQDGGTPATSQGNVFRITRIANPLFQDAGTPDGGAGSNATTTDLQAYTWNNLAATPKWQIAAGFPIFPTWISDDTRLDVSCGSSGCDSWDIRLRVKIVGAGQGNFASPTAAPGQGMELPTTFKFWYELKTVLVAGTPELASPYSSLEFNPAVVLADPDLISPANFADENTFGGPRFPATSDWMTVGLDSSDPTCIKGINLKQEDISVVNAVTGPAGGNQISLLGANTFHARPTNNTGGNLAGAGLLASFRIADWNTASHSSAIWRDVPGCGSATGAGTVANLAAFDLSCPWTLSSTERCDYAVPSGRPDGCPPPSKDDHQCVLVQLRTAASGFYFSSASAYRNLDFVGASEFHRAVRIDVNGLPSFAVPNPLRDVYVYIQTRNMPARVSDAAPNPAPGQSVPATGATAGDGLAPELLKRLQLPANGRIGSAESDRIQKALAAGLITWSDIAQIMPTHVAYVWHDTGRTITVGGTSHKLLRPQSSFGFFVSHDGELTGWENKLEGATVTQLGPNFYKVAVLQDGFVKAETVIRALGEATATCNSPLCMARWIWILIILVALLILVLVWRGRAAAHPR